MNSGCLGIEQKKTYILVKGFLDQNVVLNILRGMFT